MSVLTLPVEHYADEINAVCARLDATGGGLECHEVFDALVELGRRDDPYQECGIGDGDRTWDAVAAALAYYLRDGDADNERLSGYGSFGGLYLWVDDGAFLSLCDTL